MTSLVIYFIEENASIHYNELTILKDVIRIDALNGQLQTRILFLVSVAFVIITALLKQAQFLTLQTNGKRCRFIHRIL